MIRSKIIVLVLFVFCFELNSFWKKEVFNVREVHKILGPLSWEERIIYPVCIGDGRGDGRNKVYSTEFYKYGTYAGLMKDYKRLIEYQWDNNNKDWAETIVLDYGRNEDHLMYGRSIDSVAIGDARNDGKHRIYVKLRLSETEKYCREYEWFGSSYSYIDLPNIPIVYSSEIKIENARNDGKKRLYAFPYEYEWTGSSWSMLVIDNSLSMLFDNNRAGYNSLEIIEGRNDGKKRIYVLGSSIDSRAPYSYYSMKQKYIHRYYQNDFLEIFEYTWNPETVLWERNEIVSKIIDSVYGLGSVGYTASRMKIGCLKNDGINRLYYLENGETGATLVEFEWKNNAWAGNILGTYKLGYGHPFIFSITDIKNKGKNNMYIDAVGGWLGVGGFYEYEWDEQKKKFTSQIIEYEDMMGFVVGKAKGDGKNRIYAAPGYELEYNPDYFEKVKTEKLIPINNYFNPETGGKCSIICRVENSGDMSLKIYTLTGELVKTFIEGNKGNGEYIFSWDGKNNNGETVGSGIYLAHLEGPRISETKKIGVVK